MMKAYILVNVRTGSIIEVMDNLRRVACVEEVNMTFGPYDVVAIVETEDIKALGSVIARDIQPIPGILETLTCLVVDV
jgi:DNA-binding Lrp family transcriptional regulator